MSKKKFEAARRYNATADGYDRRYRDIQFAKYREVIPDIDILESDLIIDVGGGTGLVSEHLSKHKRNIIVVDLSYKMLKVGLTNQKESHFVCADSESLPFRHTSCEAIFFFSILQNLESPNLSLAEGYRTLKRGGIVTVTVLKKLFEQEKLLQILNKTGFSIDKNWILSIEDIAFVGKKK